MLEYMAYGTARKRLLYLLHKLSQKFGVRPAAGEGESTEPEWTELQISLTHQELASMMGSIRETVTVLLSGLVSEGIMKRRAPGNPLSVQAERLKAALQECT
ncbi:helix-turn-helix domain-containing protein [Paenibacillus sp. P26]|nr:helix-turn-helix domain-containing protein [Paenibacillus sp. P26]UUZ92795.1 helix-turn-helix domain-containing protein [Paenibacillus sp. P25]